MSLFGPFILFVNEETDEDYSDDVERLMDLGLTEKDAKEFITSNPLYEVKFEFYIDPAIGVAYCTKVDLGDDDEPFMRPAPGQQLALFDEDVQPPKAQHGRNFRWQQ